MEQKKKELDPRHWATLTKQDVFDIGRFQYLVNFYHRAYSDYMVNREVCHLADLFKKEYFTEMELIEAYNKDVESITQAVNHIISVYGLNIRRL